MEEDELKEIIDAQHLLSFDHIQLDSSPADRQPESTSETPVDFYALLNVTRDASTEDIKASYRRLSMLYHPDKQQNSEGTHVDIQHASDKFILINHAHQVLSNEDTRKIYDMYGHAGLEDMLQVSRPLKTSAEIRAEFSRVKYRQRKARVEELMRSSTSSMEVTLDASSLVDEDELRVGGAGAEVTGLQLVQSTDIPIDPLTSVGLSGVIVSRNNKGGGYLLTSIRRAGVLSGQVDAEFALGTRSFATVKYSRQLNSSTLIYASANWQQMPWDGPPVLEVSATKGLSPNMQGTLTYNSGLFSLFGWGHDGVPDDSLEISLKRTSKVTGSSLKAVVDLGVQSQSVQLRYKRRIDKETALEVSATTALGGDSSVSLGTSLNLVPNYRYISSLNMGLSGVVSVKVGITRYTSTIAFPIILSHELDVRAMALALSFPILSTFAVRRIRDVVARANARITKSADPQAREEAQKDLEIMQAQYQKKLTAEQAKESGLVITRALYGRLQDFQSIRTVLNENPQLALQQSDDECLIDVTIPVQMAVNDSRLVMGESKKSQFLGFYDPCPGEEKCLWIRYEYRGQSHESISRDNERVMAPMRQHRI